MDMNGCFSRTWGGSWRVLFVALLLVASHQPAPAEPLRRIGVLTGFASNWRSFTRASSQNQDYGASSEWLLGASTQWTMPVERLSLTTEFMILKKGFTRDDPFGGTLEYDDRYLSVPILATYELVSSPMVPYLLAGPSLEIRIKTPEDMDQTNLAMQIGGGVRWRHFALGGRYTQDVTNAVGASRSGPQEVKNRAFLLTFGMHADLSRAEQ